MADPVITITGAQLYATFWGAFIGFVIVCLFVLWKRSRVAEDRHGALRETVRHLDDRGDRTRDITYELRDRIETLEKAKPLNWWRVPDFLAEHEEQTDADTE